MSHIDIHTILAADNLDVTGSARTEWVLVASLSLLSLCLVAPSVFES